MIQHNYTYFPGVWRDVKERFNNKCKDSRRKATKKVIDE
jgi:hypothetical protein